MGRKCIFRCKNYERLYSFPNDDNHRAIWCDLLSLEYSRIGKTHRVCDFHFEEYDRLRRLDVFAFPKKRIVKSIQHMDILSAPGLEKIYLTEEMQPTPKTNDQSPKTSQSPKKDACIQTLENRSNENSTFEPVDQAFKVPPKRTYGSSCNSQSHPKTPKIDITSTCYCRCHKGEDEKRILNRKIAEMKLIIADQSREINLLISKNKVSEHLLKGKVKKIAELQSLEESLRTAMEGLNVRISIMSKREIQASSNASEDSIVLARMICDRRKKYTKPEVVVANKLYSISGRCYHFMRDILNLNLPHPTTLLRNRQILSSVFCENTINKNDNNGGIMDSESHENIDFSHEQLEEYQEDDSKLEVSL